MTMSIVYEARSNSLDPILMTPPPRKDWGVVYVILETLASFNASL